MNKIIFADIITIGDEILFGQITDTNTQFIASELDKIGVKVRRKSSVGDEKAEIYAILEESQKRSKIVILTGGLGPTKDDITKKCLAEFFQDTLEINPHAEAFVRDFFEKRGRPFTELNRQQAALPKSCTYLPNPRGTAPGMWFEKNDTVFISLPGVPYEMENLILTEVIPRLKNHFELGVIVHKVVRTIGIGESFLAEAIESWELSLPNHIKLAYLPSFGEVKLRLTATGSDPLVVEKDIDSFVQSLSPIIGTYIYSLNNENIEEAIGRILKAKNATVSFAESCTGGHVSHILTKVPGSSTYFPGSIVSYSNEAKIKFLNVQPKTLSKFGAVSEETVKEMAEGVRLTMNSTYGVAISGIAGPDGGTAEKPVGTVCIAVSSAYETLTKKQLLVNNRLSNIQYATKMALNMLRIFIDKEKDGEN
ncbi:MAG: competence/damage-inducible protein A [Leadbetterella sp.]